MLSFIVENIGTIVVLLLLTAVVAAIVCKLVRDRKKGKSVVCGGDCSRCHGCPHGEQK